MNRSSFTERIATYFKARPGHWIRATELEAVGGRQAWRTRLSECRKAYGMQIDNRCRRVMSRSGEMVTVSEYRYTPRAVPTQDGLPLELGA